MTFTEIEPASASVHFLTQKRGTLFLSTNFVENMFSLKRSENINTSLLAKHFLKTKLKIPFFRSKLEY